MKNRQELESFLRSEALSLYSPLSDSHSPRWGSMDPRQMLEHLGLAMQVSNGKIDMQLNTPIERVEKLKNISLLSDRPLPVNFQNPVLTVKPQSYRFTGLQHAREELAREMDDFFNYFSQKDATYKRMHNIFGELSYDEWLVFHYKHFMHHAMQFGLVSDFTRL